VPVREPAFTGSGVTEVERHSSSSTPSPSPALKKARYPFTAGWAERVFEQHHCTNYNYLNPGPVAPVASALNTQLQHLPDDMIFCLTVHRLCSVSEGRLGHFLPHWLRTGWQSVISQGKIPWNTPPWLGIEPGPQVGQTVSYSTELSWLTTCQYDLALGYLWLTKYWNRSHAIGFRSLYCIISLKRSELTCWLVF